MLQRQATLSQRGRIQLSATRRERSSETRIDPRLYDLFNFRKERLHHRIVVLRAEFTMRLGGGADLLRRQVRRAESQLEHWIAAGQGRAEQAKAVPQT
jgi:hypothetical protein